MQARREADQALGCLMYKLVFFKDAFPDRAAILTGLWRLPHDAPTSLLHPTALALIGPCLAPHPLARTHHAGADDSHTETDVRVTSGDGGGAGLSVLARLDAAARPERAAACARGDC
jgi:hypothetical protein